MLDTPDRLVLLALRDHGPLTRDALAGYVDLAPGQLDATLELLAGGRFTAAVGRVDDALTFAISDGGRMALAAHYGRALAGYSAADLRAAASTRDADEPALEFKFVVRHRNPLHVRVAVFAGQRGRDLGACGTLTLAASEWDRGLAPILTAGGFEQNTVVTVEAKDV